MTEKEFINEALPTSGHLPMYVMHKFFARKQEDVIREYIQAYSKKGEIICDPFCGSGVTIGEAIRLGRKAIGIDINPVSVFITRNTLKPVSDIEKITLEFNRIDADVKTDITGLYQTSCRDCGQSVSAICFTWKDREMIDVRYDCPQHGRTINPVNDEDLELLKKIENGEITTFFDDNGSCCYWFPTNKLYYDKETPFLKKEQYNSVDELFTKRNLVSLGKLYDRIKRIEDLELQEAFKFAFSSMTHLASKMTPVRPSRPFSSAWVQQSYWFCPQHMESNVWILFVRAVMGRQGLIKAKESLSEDFKDNIEVPGFNELNRGQGNNYLLLESSINDVEEIKENSIDFVLADPPYGYSIQYGELLYMWGSWLQILDNFPTISRGEIIVNPRQKKINIEYEHMLTIAFKKVFHWLKPGGYCIVTFHNPNLKYRNILFRSVLLNGFEFERIVYQPPPRASAKSLLQPFGSQRGDYFFRFRKPKEENEISYESIDENQVERLIVDIVQKIIFEKGKPIHCTEIQNKLDPYLYEELKKSHLLMDFNPENIETILRRYIGDVFEIVDLEITGRGSQKVQNKGWWLINSKRNK
ncbi:MAG: DNA methyltransferase [Candidatus Thorarchaeota archaeon]